MTSRLRLWFRDTCERPIVDVNYSNPQYVDIDGHGRDDNINHRAGNGVAHRFNSQIPSRNSAGSSFNRVNGGNAPESELLGSEIELPYNISSDNSPRSRGGRSARSGLVSNVIRNANSLDSDDSLINSRGPHHTMASVTSARGSANRSVNRNNSADLRRSTSARPSHVNGMTIDGSPRAKVRSRSAKSSRPMPSFPQQVSSDYDALRNAKRNIGTTTLFCRRSKRPSSIYIGMDPRLRDESLRKGPVLPKEMEDFLLPQVHASGSPRKKLNAYSTPATRSERKGRIGTPIAHKQFFEILSNDISFESTPRQQHKRRQRKARDRYLKGKDLLKSNSEVNNLCNNFYYERIRRIKLAGLDPFSTENEKYLHPELMKSAFVDGYWPNNHELTPRGGVGSQSPRTPRIITRLSKRGNDSREDRGLKQPLKYEASKEFNYIHRRHDDMIENRMNELKERQTQTTGRTGPGKNSRKVHKRSTDRRSQQQEESGVMPIRVSVDRSYGLPDPETPIMDLT